MSAEVVARTIQLILAPTVMVSACAILLGGLLTRYAAINDRLRAMAHERIELLPSSTMKDALVEERIEEIDAQVPDLLYRHRLQHDAVFAVYCSILVFLFTMFVIAIAATLAYDWLPALAIASFVVGAIILLIGVAFATREVRTSHLALRYELLRVTAIKQ